MADSAAFPALPAAQTPAAAGFSVFAPGSTGGRVVRRDIGRAAGGNVWETAGARGSGAVVDAGAGAAEVDGGGGSTTAGEVGAAGAGKGKKSGRKKQTLMHFG